MRLNTSLLLTALTLVPASVFAGPRAGSADQVEVESLPAIGKWLLDANGEVAHWLGYRFNDKELDEPINVIVRVNQPNESAALDALVRAAAAAGFESRRGHSTGYQALLNGQRTQQFPQEADHALSDGFYLTPNNHGRFFGPVRLKDEFYFIAAFSKEETALFKKLLDRKTLLHPYSSFQEARERFATQMEKYGGAKRLGMVPLQNSISEDGSETTGDHDGFAVLLEIQ